MTEISYIFSGLNTVFPIEAKPVGNTDDWYIKSVNASTELTGISSVSKEGDKSIKIVNESTATTATSGTILVEIGTRSKTGYPEISDFADHTIRLKLTGTKQPDKPLYFRNPTESELTVKVNLRQTYTSSSDKPYCRRFIFTKYNSWNTIKDGNITTWYGSGNIITKDARYSNTLEITVPAGGVMMFAPYYSLTYDSTYSGAHNSFGITPNSRSTTSDVHDSFTIPEGIIVGGNPYIYYNGDNPRASQLVEAIPTEETSGLFGAYLVFEGTCTDYSELILPAPKRENQYCRIFYGAKDSIKKIPEKMFSDPLSNVPAGAYYYALNGCSNLENTNISLDVNGTIGNEAFYKMLEGANVKEVSITASTTSTTDQAISSIAISNPYITKVSINATGNFNFGSSFNGCTNLTEASITGTSIYYATFSGCSNLVNVSITGISGDLKGTSFCRTFYNCPKLTGTINFSNISSINNNTFNNTFTNSGTVGSGFSVILPDSLTINGQYNFKEFCNGSGVKSITTSSGTLKLSTASFEIFRDAFNGCTGLVSFPGISYSGTYLGSYAFYNAFYGCTSLTKTPEFTESNIGTESYKQMFYGCTSLTDASNIKLTINGSSSGNYNSMFYGCSLLVKPPTITGTKVGSSECMNMFRECKSLKTFTLTDSISSIGSSGFSLMFYGCTSLTTFNMTISSNASISSSGFYGMFIGCTSLTGANISLGSGITVQDYTFSYMFSGCTSLKKIISLGGISFSSGFGYVCQSMYSGCTGLVSLNTANYGDDFNLKDYLPSSTTLSYCCYKNMFKGCTGIKGVKWNIGSITALANCCFEGMFEGTGLTTLSYPESIGNISLETKDSCFKRMFANCKSLTTTVGTLGIYYCSSYATNCCYEMYAGCTSLVNGQTTSAQVPQTSAFEGMYNGCTSLTKLEHNMSGWDSGFLITGATTGVLRNTFKDCTSLTSIELKNLNNVGAYGMFDCFNGCTSLATVIMRNYNKEPATSYFSGWLTNVASSGTITLGSTTAAISGVRDIMGIPSGWTITT